MFPAGLRPAFRGTTAAAAAAWKAALCCRRCVCLRCSCWTVGRLILSSPLLSFALTAFSAVIYLLQANHGLLGPTACFTFSRLARPEVFVWYVGCCIVLRPCCRPLRYIHTAGEVSSAALGVSTLHFISGGRAGHTRDWSYHTLLFCVCVCVCFARGSSSFCAFLFLPPPLPRRFRRR